MLYLNTEQQNFLNTLSKTESIDCFALSEKELKIVEFLDEEGLIDSKREQHTTLNPITNEFHTFPGAYLSVSISEKGKSHLVESKVDSDRYKHPFAVSVISLTISLLSLVLSAVSILMQLG